MTVSPEGIVTGVARYLPYGQPRVLEGSESLPTDKTFIGQRAEAFGLMDYNARFYDPSIMMFISPDTFIPNPYNPLDWNRYQYARGNPLRYHDPSGHIPVDIILDLIFLGYDVGAILIEGPTTVNMAALAADAACALIPYGTGGGIAIRLGGEAALQGAAHIPAYLRALQATTKAAQFSVNAQESSVGDSLSGQSSIENLVRGDDGVRQYLGMGKDQKAADFLYFDKDVQRWAIGESKGGKLQDAVKQITNTYDALVGKTPGAKGSTDFFIATNENNWQRLLNGQRVDGYLMKDGYLGWYDEANNWVYQTIDGNRVRVFKAP